MLSLVAPAAEVPCCRWSRQVAAAQHRAALLLTFGKFKCVCWSPRDLPTASEEEDLHLHA